MAKILFTDKVKIKDIPVAEINKFTDANANEIKTVVNGLDDSVIANTTEIEILRDSVSTGENKLIEKGFHHIINFDWYVFAQKYRFNGILYEASEDLVIDTVTIDPAPTTVDFKRFDVVVFNDDFTFSKVKGDEGLNPAIPKIDIITQIQLTVILVEYGTTEPSYLTKQLMYDEGVGLPTEFAVTKTGTSIEIDNLEQSSSGTKSIKVTNPVNSDVLFLDKNTTFNSLDVDTISFKVKNVIAGNWRFHLYSYNSIGGFYQGTATIKNGSFGYSSQNITDFQTIIVPISKILGTGEIHNTGFALTFFNDSTGTFFFDEFSLNGNFTQAPDVVLSGDMFKNVYDINNNGIVDNAEKVNGFTVETAVPAGAVFTDTIYDDSDVLKDSDALSTVTASNKLATEAELLALSGELTAPAVSETYADIATMLAAQGTQTLNYFYKVNDASADPTISEGKAVYQYLGTTLGTLADYDLVWKLETGATVGSGTTLPTGVIPQGLFFIAIKTNRRILMQYDGVSWNPIRSFGTMTIWVNALGTDDPNYGDGTGVNAYETIEYAVSQIPPQYYGDVFVIVQAGTYNEEVYVSGKNSVGDFKIKIEGEYTSITGSFTSIAIDTTLGRFKPSDSSKSWTTNQHKYKFLHITSGVNVGCVLPIISNTATELTCSYEGHGYRKDSYIYNINNLFGVSSTGNTYEIITPTTLINGHIFSKGSLISCQFLKYTCSSRAYNFGSVFLGGVQLFVNGDTQSRFLTILGSNLALSGCSLWSTSALYCWAILQVTTANADIRACFIESYNTTLNGGILYWVGSTGSVYANTMLGKMELAVNSSVGFGWDTSTISNFTNINVYSSSVGQRLNTTFVVATKTIDAATYGVSTTS